MQDPRLSPAQKAELEVEIEAEVSRIGYPDGHSFIFVAIGC